MKTPAWQLPLQWPLAAAERHAAAARSRERVIQGAVLAALVALTVLDRFGLRVIESYPIHPSMLAIWALLAAMALTGSAELNPRGALAYLAVASVAALSYLVNGTVGRSQYVSFGSLALVLVLYAPFAVSLRPEAAPPALWRWIVTTYVGFALFLAVAGIAQFFAQFAFRPAWLFDYTALIPAPIRGSEVWNTVNWAGDWVKSNGFFLREASGFSFEMAFAILCELATRRRKWVIATFAFALVLTYSGSGIVALAAAMLFPLRRSLVQLLAIVALGAALFFVLGEALNLSYTAARVDEFGHEKSSAYCRFVQPGAVVARELDAQPWAAVLGHGPGTMQKMHDTCETTFAKVPFEYGLLGALAMGVLVTGVLNRAAAPMRLRVALALKWLVLGALLEPANLLVMYLFSAMWPPGTAAQALKGQGAG